jgi:hypothetical protein
LLRKTDIGPLQSTVTTRYFIGSDQSERVRVQIGRQFEVLFSDAWKAFRLLRPNLKAPEWRLMVVFLGDPKKYEHVARFCRVDPSLKGFYACNIGTIFLSKYEASGDGEWDRATLTKDLRHEGVHQFTYEAGILNRAGDRPACVVEGLGILGEPESRAEGIPLLRSHPLMLKWLIEFADGVRPSLADFFRDDKWTERYDDSKVRYNGYAWSWLLMHLLMSDEKLRPRLDAYLTAIYPRTDSSQRLKDVEDHFGKLADLEKKLTRHLDELANPPTPAYRSIRRQ